MWRRAQYFVKSSLAPVLLLRRRAKWVADVLQGIRQKGFAQGRWDALCGWWNVGLRPRSLWGPLRSSEAWVHWIPPELGVFFFEKWVFDASGVSSASSTARAGNFLRKGTEENKKFVQYTMDLLSIPN